MTRGPWWRPLLSWPLLAGAAVVVAGGAGLLATGDARARDVAGVSLVVLGAVLLGAWVYAMGAGTGSDGD